MKTFNRVTFFLIFITLISCDNILESESISPIIGTELPTTATVGETISFRVFHVVFNGCGTYSRQETEREGNVITVTFYGKYPEGRMCTDDIPTLETFYQFEVKEKGDYYFRFYQGDFGKQEYILDTLRVQ